MCLEQTLIISNYFIMELNIISLTFQFIHISQRKIIALFVFTYLRSYFTQVNAHKSQIQQQRIKTPGHINNIKYRTLQFRLFLTQFSEIEIDHIRLFIYTEVRSPSREIMHSTFEPYFVVRLFLRKTDFKFINKFTVKLCMLTLAYLMNILNRINVLNLSQQGKLINRFLMNDKIISIY